MAQNHNYSKTIADRVLQLAPGNLAEIQRRPVADSWGFASVESYMKTFVPLHFQECVAQIDGQLDKLRRNRKIPPFRCVADPDERRNTISVSVMGVRDSSSFKNVASSQVHRWQGQTEPFRRLDVLVFSTSPIFDCQQRPTSGSIAGGSGGNLFFGVVQRVRALSPYHKVPGVREEALFELQIKANFDHFRRENKQYFAWQIESLNTVQREYDALLNVRSLQILEPLLNANGREVKAKAKKAEREGAGGASSSRGGSRENEAGSNELLDLGNENDLSLSPRYRSYIKEKFNAPQHDAIIAATTLKGFTLIQVPPGTGKTTTLHGVLNTLHLHIYSKYYKAITRSMYVVMRQCRSVCRFDSANMKLKDETEKWASASLWWEKWMTMSFPQKPRILMAAPSNAAVDNMAMRILTNKFVDGAGSHFHPRMLRLGSGHGRALHAISLNDEIKKYEALTTDSLKAMRATAEAKQKQAKQNLLSVFRFVFFNLLGPHRHQTSRSDEEKVKSDFLRAKENFDRATTEIGIYDTLQGPRNEASRRRLKEIVISQAEIVFSTLSSAGLRIIENTKFSVCVIDEAAQSTEVSTLIPLRLGCDQCVLCGDPAQLPATIHSKGKTGVLCRRSLFERLQKGGHCVHFLSLQYRMHPLICSFPSAAFYGGLLKSGISDPNAFRRPYHGFTGFSSLVFYDIAAGQEQQCSRSLSYSNKEEAAFCIQLIFRLCKSFKTCVDMNRIGVICMYSDQVRLLRERYKQFLATKKLDSNKYPSADSIIRSVDGFQGQERDVVVLSTVRADGNAKKGVGFVSDCQRMNVALTRAKYSMLVVGRKSSLENSPVWGKFIKHVVQKGIYLTVTALDAD